MAGKFHHEAIYRGEGRLAQLAAVPLTLCGAGALGSQLADNLARQGFAQLRVIDRDRGRLRPIFPPGRCGGANNDSTFPEAPGSRIQDTASFHRQRTVI